MIKKALIIGNSEYENQPLPKSINDANAIKEFLNKVKFEVTIKFNLDYNSFYSEVDEFGENTKNADVRFFYFSGHGINLEGKNYLIPTDFKILSKYDIKRCIELDQILKKLQLDKLKVNIVILDSCNSNPTNIDFKGINDITGFSTMQIPSGSIIGYAAKAGTFAIAKKNSDTSLYTTHLLKYLNQPDLEIEKVLKYAQRDVITETNWEQTPCYLSEFIGDFSFHSTNINIDENKNLGKSEVFEYSEEIEPGIFKNKLNKYTIRIAPTVFFEQRISKAFPGVRGLKWFEGNEAFNGLKRLLKEPLSFEDAEGYGLYHDPIWWFRGRGALPIETFVELSEGKFLMWIDEIKIDKIAVFHNQSYFRSFVYVETIPEKPVGVYKTTEEKIMERVKEFGYVTEEYGLFNGKAITRQEYDDGAAFIDGEYVELVNPQLRCRYLSKYNFIITAKSAPYNSHEGDILADKYFDGILRGEKTLEQYVDEAKKLPKNIMDK